MKVLFNKSNIAHITMFQWDFGQTLEFFPEEEIGEGSEVHFPLPNETLLAVVKVANNECRIPDGTLTLAQKSVDAFLYVNNGSSGKTKKTIHINLISRPKPAGYEYDPSDDEVLNYNELYERVKRVVTAAENGEYNGKDGVDGKDGSPGKDGVDGYTPIKGVDYFDGEPGAKGDPGEPGEAAPTDSVQWPA